MYGGYEYGGMEYAGADITEDGAIADLEPHANVEEFCVMACSSSSI